MADIIGISMERKKRDPYTEFTPEELQAIFGGDPGKMGMPGGPDGPGGPGGPPAPIFARDENATACIIVDHGRLDEANTNAEGRGATPYDASRADGIQIITSDGHTGGVYCTGEGTDFTLENAVISIAGNGPDGMLGGKSTAVEATDHARVTIRNCDISASGASRSTTICQNYGEMRIYDSTLVAHGAPWGSTKREHRPSAVYREFEGNARNHCTMANGKTWFYDCRIYTDGWAAVSTDAAQGYVYVEANDCDIRTRSGYAAYADNGCYDVFNRCKIRSGAMAAVLAGECGITYNGCRIDCDSYFVKVHCVMGRPIELAYLDVNGCDIRSKSTALLSRSANTEINIRASSITAENGELLKAEANPDPGATKTNGREVYGVHGTFTDCELTGDVISADPDRNVYVYLKHTVLRGAIHGAFLTLDDRSRWVAERDSDVILVGEIDMEQIDAPEGVTITATAGETDTRTLRSGGTLILKQ